MKLEFTKMHGAGNDYIYVNTMIYPIADPEKAAREWSAYHTGIGSDGLVLIGASDKADFSMRIFNNDGSEAGMCGNACYCVAKYLYEYGLTDKETITLETLSGNKILKLNIQDKTVDSATIDMGIPADIKPVDFGCEYSFKAVAVSMGNPHLVIFTDDIACIDLPIIGPNLENHPFFPGRINVEFAQIIGKDNIRMRVWERGSGITRACGTGACATAAAAGLSGKAGRTIRVTMDGGQVAVNWDVQTEHIFLTGIPIKVFDGSIELTNI